ncbi:hypothetical protein Y032_0033g2778 [Ancylostoma ceylanicum]|uniref:Uncharacterized protein n=1 Tax=Ancylostoma ceylanicum TaxID=53326 RepID=A0A016UMR4_9BILA|nr:hypothetical protein Y032_0033g2778 [Ancylostoma ceylanicum]
MVYLICGGGGRRSPPQEAGRGRGDRFACSAWKPTRTNAARRRVWFEPNGGQSGLLSKFLVVDNVSIAPKSTPRLRQCKVNQNEPAI